MLLFFFCNVQGVFVVVFSIGVVHSVGSSAVVMFLRNVKFKQRFFNEILDGNFSFMFERVH